MGISVYSVYRIRGEVRQKNTTLKSGDVETPYVKVEKSGGTILTTGEPNSWDRIRIIYCYDLVMAIYYILCVVWVMWLGSGTNRVIEGDVDSACGRWVVLSVVFGFLYMGIGVVSWVGSLCLLRYHTLQEGKTPSSDGVLVVDDAGGVSLA